MDSSSFNVNAFFKDFVKDRSLVQVIEKNNQLFTESKQLDSDLQTLVYENYSKFMAASDTLAEIHLEMSALDTDLEDLRNSVKSINKTYETVEDSLQMKWKQIRKLDTTERDLNKLQYLSELPNMFKDALTKFQNAADRDKDVNVFSEPVQYYSDYSDILTNYKQTKFMISLYGEIKSYISRIKTYLLAQLDNLAQTDCEKSSERISADAKTITKFLLIFGEDKSSLKFQFQKIKQQQIAKHLEAFSKEYESKKDMNLQEAMDLLELHVGISRIKEAI